MMRLSVTARLALLAIGLALVSNLVLAGFLWQQIHDDAIEVMRRDTTEQSDALAAVYRSGGGRALAGALRDARASGDESLIAAIVDRRGRRLLGIGPAQILLGGPGTSAFRIGYVSTAMPWAQREAGVAIRPIGRVLLVNGRLLDDWEQAQRTIERALLIATLISLVIGVAGGLVVTRYVGLRLDRIAVVMRRVGTGDFSERVDLVAGGADAFDRLAAQLNTMLDKVERLMTELRLVADSLAHDLRSPLARLRSKAEVAAQASEPRAREVALGGLLIETDLIMQMLTMLIEITRSESVPHDRFTIITPRELIEEIADLYEPVVEEAELEGSLIIDRSPPPMRLHRELLSQALSNLIDNAVRHAAAGGAIVIRLDGDLQSVRFQIEDRGPGIAAGDEAEARRRFGRLDGARTRPGAGLGLALVEAVARLHGGRLILSDNHPGLIATIELPIAPAGMME